MRNLRIAMTNLWSSPIGLDYYYDSASDLSPLTQPRSMRHAVPVGTVASRISELQNLANNSSSKGLLSPNRNREANWSGFGRRKSTRFGQPASVSSKPDEQTQVNVNHSFAGLTTRRANHLQDHARVDARSKWDRTAGLHAQLQPSGLGGRVQYEATSPWVFLPRSKLQKNIQDDYVHKETDIPETNKQTTQLSTSEPITPLPTSSTNYEMEEKSPGLIEPFPQTPDEMRRRVISRAQRADMSGWTSIETTSTVRRQSVRDLYHYYGIQRPSGLASVENSPYNSEMAPQRSEHKNGELSFQEHRKRHRTLSKSYPFDQGGVHGQVFTPTHGNSRQSTKFPALYLEEATPRHGSRLTPPSYIEMPDRSMLHSATAHSTSTHGITPPFLTANMLSPTYSVSFLPISRSVASNHTPRSPYNSRRDNKHGQGLSCHSSSSGEIVGGKGMDSCGTPSCQATHRGHRPYRHSISCIRKRNRYAEESDSGYMAGGSHFDEFDTVQHQDDYHHGFHHHEHSDHSHEVSQHDHGDYFKRPLPHHGEESSKQQGSTPREEIPIGSPEPQGIHTELHQINPTEPAGAPAVKAPIGTHNDPLILEVNQPSGFASPNKSNTTSRKLSAFIRFQEQNIVPVLNKRLREHQEELKRIERMCQEQIDIASQKKCLHPEESHTLFGKGLIQNNSGNSPHTLQECEDMAGNGQQEVHGIGIKGVTILIHLEGKEDVVIKTDLSPAGQKTEANASV